MIAQVNGLPKALGTVGCSAAEVRNQQGSQVVSDAKQDTRYTQMAIGRPSSPMPALAQPLQNTLKVRDGDVDRATRFCDNGIVVQGLDPQAFQECSSLNARPAYGKDGHISYPTSITELKTGWYSGVPYATLAQAGQSIGAQCDQGEHKDWCCGPNSAARALAMLNRAAPDMDEFYRQCPKSNFAGWTWGPAPVDLKNFLDRSGHFDGVWVRATQVEQPHVMERLILDAANNGRPMIPLLIWGQTSMHYPLVVGRTNDHIVLMETNGGLYKKTMPQLLHEMRCPFIVAPNLKNFNAIEFNPRLTARAILDGAT